MKIAFSEVAPDYTNYVYPYHVWGFLEEGESVRVAYGQGFLPVSYSLSRFYLTRSIRVDLARFEVTRRVRYVQRKCASIRDLLLPRESFDFSIEWQTLAKGYFAVQETAAEYRRARFFEMIDSPLCTHVMVYTDSVSGQPVGLTPIFIRDGIAQYGIAVYDPAFRAISIGSHMIAAALGRLRSAGLDYVYVGSCYTRAALYKTRFSGAQFFNGYTWSEDREELHFFVSQSASVSGQHFLGSEPYLEAYCGGDPDSLAQRANVVRLTPIEDPGDGSESAGGK